MMESKIDTLIDKLSRKIMDLENANQKLEASLCEQEKRCAKLEEVIVRLNTSSSTDHSTFEAQVRLEHLENSSKEKNIVIYGVARDAEETLINLAESVIPRIEKATQTQLRYKQMFRPGRSTSAPIIVELEDKQSRDELLKKARLLKGTDIVIARDYCFGTRRKRKVLNIKRLEAIKDGKKAMLRDDQLIIESEIFVLNKDDQIVSLGVPGRRPSRRQ